MNTIYKILREKLSDHKQDIQEWLSDKEKHLDLPLYTSVDIRDAGDPVEVARRYDREGADEITFLDITATHDNRDTIVHVVEQVASEVFIPLTVGGGIRKLEDIRCMLNAGADKVGINSAAMFNPEFVKEAADKFGSQCIVVAIDAKK